MKRSTYLKHHKGKVKLTAETARDDVDREVQPAVKEQTLQEFYESIVWGEPLEQCAECLYDAAFVRGQALILRNAHSNN